MKILIEDTDLMEISSIFTYKLQAEVAEILEKHNLTDNLIDFFKSETHYHTNRVQVISLHLAKHLGLTDEECRIVCEIAPFHDIGKLLTPPEILNKEGRLTDKEFKIIKAHTSIGFNILKNSGNETLELAAMVAHEHHERWNGKGYPNGLKGKEIHIYSRIVTVADVFDSLISPRCYKEIWTANKVKSLFKSEEGEQFDPEIVDILLENFQEFTDLHDKIYCCI